MSIVKIGKKWWVLDSYHEVLDGADTREEAEVLREELRRQGKD